MGRRLHSIPTDSELANPPGTRTGGHGVVRAGGIGLLLKRTLTLLVLICTLFPIFSYSEPVVSEGAMRSSRLTHHLQRMERQPQLRTELITVILESDILAIPGSLAVIYGGKLRFKHGRLHEISIPADRLSALLQALPASVFARLPYPYQAVVVSQGVSIIGASDMQALGQDGTGVTIGVIDAGFGSLSASQAAGELPSNLTIVDYTGTGTGGITHGTNVAEIAYDVAPGASFYLAKIGSDVQMFQAMNDMAAAGVNVINHSLVWFGAAFYDGTGPICDIADSAENQGMQWVNAMGNSRTQH